MAGTIRVNIEIGPKGKRVVAYSPDWPGFNRGAKTEEAALETLHAYLPRYAPITELAGLAADFPTTAALTDLAITERYTGTGSTDFWGISFAFSPIDHEPMAAEELERQLALLRAAWAYFDLVRARVSPEMRKGPAAAAATATTSSATPSPANSKTGPENSASPPSNRSPSKRTPSPHTARPTSPPSASITPKANPPAPGPSATSSATPRSTPSTTPGKWKTRTSQT